MAFIEDHEHNYWSWDKLEGETRNHENRFQKIIDFITRDNKNDKLLDVGCGTGWIARKLKEKGYQAPILNLDIKQEYVDKLKEMGFQAVKGDARNLPFRDGEFETVTCNEVLEHLRNPGKALSELTRVASKRVIMTIPIGRSQDDFHAYLIRGEIVGSWLVLEWEKCEGV